MTFTPSRTVSGDVAYAPFGETYASSGSPGGATPAAGLSESQCEEQNGTYVLSNTSITVDVMPPPPPGPTDEVNTGSEMLGWLLGSDPCISISGPVFCGSSWPAAPSALQVEAPQSPQTQGSKRHYQQCTSSFNNSMAGRAVQFGSVPNIVSNFWEWAGLTGGKTGAVTLLDKAEQSATVEDYTITGGTWTEAAPLVGSKILGIAGLYGVGAATATDAAARLGCSDPNPRGTAALAAPILPFF